MTATILVIEDEPAIQALLSLNLQRAGYQVQCAGSLKQAQASLEQSLPDLVLLDWMLPDGSGVRLARALRAHRRTQAIPLIMLTARSSEQDIVAGLEAGADDYIGKPFSVRELLARIRSLLRRRTPQLSPDTVQAGPLRLDPETRSASGHGRALPMGPTEFRLLHFLATHAGRVYNRSQLLDQVWGEHAAVEERTVDVHVRRLRKALARAGLQDSIQTIRGAGYRFEPPDTL
ncbi:phosphate regulon transcriptional regulator PhoB [Castellaniella sp.]|uniref:phosphate regulon transcriptional regulator PhoB n=1 Tax=Castellaniella sp. TaxID=1955812 RepID=UPI0035648F9D